MKKLLLILLSLILFLCSCGKDANRGRGERQPEGVPFAQDEDRITTESEPDMTVLTWLPEGGVALSGEGASVEGNTAHITGSGVYHLTGQSADGCVSIECTQTVRLVLDGLNLTSAQPIISAVDGGKVILTLAAGSANILRSTESAAVMTDGALTVNGNGGLSLSADADAGVRAGGQVILVEGNTTVSAQGDAVCAAEHLVIGGGFLTVRSRAGALTCPQGEVCLYDGTVDLHGDTAVRADKVSCRGGYIRLDAKTYVFETQTLSLAGGTLLADTDNAALSPGCELTDAGGVFVCGGKSHTDPVLGAGAGSCVIANGALTPGDVLSLSCAGAALLSYTPGRNVGQVLLCFPYIEGGNCSVSKNGTSVAEFTCERAIIRGDF